jgi:hypothetical protein
MAVTGNTVSITPYCVRIYRKEAGGEKKYLRDGELPGGATLQGFVDGFLGSLRETRIMDERKAGIRIQEEIRHDNAPLLMTYGNLHAGKYGFEAVLENIETSARKKRELLDCEYMPFFYAFAFKPKQPAAILLIEQFGVYSALGHLLKLLGDYVGERMPGCAIEHGTIVDEKYVKESVKKSVKAFRFIWRSVPKDLADNILDDDAEDSEGTMELAVRPRRGAAWPVSQWVSWGGRSRCAGVTVYGQPFDDLKIDVEIRGKKRTLAVDKLSCFRMSFDVTLKVKFGADGHPTRGSMLGQAKEIAEIARKTLGWRDNDKDQSAGNHQEAP